MRKITKADLKLANETNRLAQDLMDAMAQVLLANDSKFKKHDRGNVLRVALTLMLIEMLGDDIDEFLSEVRMTKELDDGLKAAARNPQ